MPGQAGNIDQDDELLSMLSHSVRCDSLCNFLPRSFLRNEMDLDQVSSLWRNKSAVWM